MTLGLQASHEVRLALRAVKAASTHLQTALDSRKMPPMERLELLARKVDVDDLAQVLSRTLRGWSK